MLRTRLVPLVGVLTVAAGSAAADDLCLGPSDAGILATFACNTFDWHLTGWRGYDTEAPPCENDFDEFDVCLHGAEYAWTISASDTDPLVNTGPLQGVATLYLWLYCASLDGLSAARFNVTGSLDVLAFTPSPGWLNAGGPTNLQLAVGGCPRDAVVAGAFLIDRVTGAGATTDVSSFGRVKALYRN